MQYLDLFDPGRCQGHETRFAASLQWLAPCLTAGAIWYDFGRGQENCPLTTAIRRHFPAVDWRTTGDADLRYPLPLPDACCEAVCATEILEHMQDPPEDPPHTFFYHGVTNLLSEALRIVRPGGRLFLTTPNHSQYGCAWRLVSGGTSLWNYAHVHEFGWHELRHFITTAGWQIDRMETVDVWEDLPCPAELREVIDRLAPDVPRGHCIFALCRRPAAAAESPTS